MIDYESKYAWQWYVLYMYEWYHEWSLYDGYMNLYVPVYDMVKYKDEWYRYH